MATETLPTPTAPAPITIPPMPNEPPAPPEAKTFAGFNVKVEHPAGSTRTGIGADGKPWSTVMRNSYGNIPNANGEDGECLDCYLGPDEAAPNVHVVHQNDAKGNYDEDKAVLGVHSPEEAKAIHQAHVPPDRFRSVTVMPKDRFASMLNKAEPGSVHWKKKMGRAHGTTAILSREEIAKFIETLSKHPAAVEEFKQGIELARAKLARCPTCKSHDVTRMAAKTPDEGPMDKCKHCGKVFSPAPFSLTAEQHVQKMARQDGLGENPVDPQSQGTTNTAGWQVNDPPVNNADGTPVDDDVDKDDEEQDDSDQIIAGLQLQSRMAKRLFKKG